MAELPERVGRQVKAALDRTTQFWRLSLLGAGWTKTPPRTEFSSLMKGFWPRYCDIRAARKGRGELQRPSKSAYTTSALSQKCSTPGASNGRP